VYAHRAKIYFAEKDYEKFDFCRNEAERLAELADKNYPEMFEISAAKQLRTLKIMSNDLINS
jgi:hypothetical protein